MPLRRRPLTVLAVIAIVMFAAMQVVVPDRSNPPTDPVRRLEAHVDVPPDVAAILDRSCRDCHTHDTRWPWYSRFAPGSWLVAYDVNHGRDEMNLSDWAAYDADAADHLLEEICEMVTEGEMPLGAYLWLHSSATLSDADVTRLCDWSEAARKELESRATATGEVEDAEHGAH